MNFRVIRAGSAMRWAWLAVVAVAMAAAAACSSDECLGNRSALPKAAFYSSTPTPAQVSIDSLTIYGIGAPGDSLLLDTARSVRQAYMPFNLDADVTRYVLEYDQKHLAKLKLTDTITFSYEKKPWFVSSACGVIYRFDVKEVKTTHHLIDSVKCPDPIIDNEDKTNIFIYFRVTAENS